jgi:hypothetical protein
MKIQINKLLKKCNFCFRIDILGKNLSKYL